MIDFNAYLDEEEKKKKDQESGKITDFNAYLDNPPEQLKPSQIAAQEQKPVQPVKKPSIWENIKTKVSNTVKDIRGITPEILGQGLQTAPERFKKVVDIAKEFVAGDSETKETLDRQEEIKMLQVESETDQYIKDTRQEIINYFKDTTKDTSKYREVLAKVDASNFDDYKGSLERLSALPLEQKRDVGQKNTTEMFNRLKMLEDTKEEADQALGYVSANRGLVKELVHNIKDWKYTFPSSYTNYTTWLPTKQREAQEKRNRGETLTNEDKAFLNSSRTNTFNVLVDKGYGTLAADVVTGSLNFGAGMYLSNLIMGGNIVTTPVAQAVFNKIPAGKAKTIIEKVVGNSVQLAVQSQFDVPQIDATTAMYMLPTVDYEKYLKDEGGSGDILDYTKSGDDAGKAQTKARINNLIQYMSEGVGDYIDDATPFIKKAFIAKFLKNRGIKPSNTKVVRGVLRDLHINGIVGEVFEEEVAEKPMSMLEERDYYDPFFTPEGRERLLVETLGIAVMQGMASVTDVSINKFRDFRNRNKQKSISLQVEEETTPPPPPPANVAVVEGTDTPQGTEGLEREEEVVEQVIPSAGAENIVVEGLTKAGDTNIKITRDSGDNGMILKSDLMKAVNLTETADKIQIQGFERNDFEKGVQTDFKGTPTKILKNIEQYAKDNNKKVEVIGIGGDSAEYWTKQGYGVVGTRAVKEVTKETIVEKATTAVGVSEKPQLEEQKAVSIKEDTAREYWSSEKPMTIDGVKYRVGKMSYGDYFLEPYGKGGGETEPFATGTIFLRESPTEKGTLIDEDSAIQKEMAVEKSKPAPKKITKTAQKKTEVPSGIISTDEPTKPTTNKDIGRKPRSRQPADTVPESPTEQEGAGETVEVNGEIVARGEREGSDTGVGIRPTTQLEESLEELPEEIQTQADEDWLENFAEDEAKRVEDVAEINKKLKEGKLTKEQKEFLTRSKDKINKESADLEEAFVSKWRRKAVEYNKPVKLTKVDQVSINKQVEDLVAEKGNGTYTDEEKSLLKQYTGSGGLETGGAEGRGLLDEYFTPKPIVDFMWDKVKNLQYGKDPKSMYKYITGGLSILEPAAGIGGFFDGNTVAGLKTAYEINKTSATIIKALYPLARVKNVPFESNFIGMRGEKIAVKPEYDIVIGNPPYGEHRGKYLGLGEEQKIVKYEEYFIKRGLDVLHNQGVLTYIVPSAFLSGGTNYAKSEIAKLGTLIDAYRLPNGVFGTTTIGTDVIFIRKQPLTGNTNTSEARLMQHERELELSDNNFFNGTPDKVLGEISKGTGNYGADEVKGTLEAAIEKAKNQPVEIHDTIPAKEVAENEQEMRKEVQEAEEKTKDATIPPVKRVPENPVITNDINKKAIIIPNKKDTKMKLSEGVSEEDMSMWKNVNVTGELNSTYTAGFDPKTFISNKMAVAIEDGVAKYYPNVMYYQGDIYEKMDNLVLSNSAKEISPKQFAIQEKGLKEVLPAPKDIFDIELSPPSDFVKGIRLEVEGEQPTRLVDMFHTYLRSLPYDAFGSSTSWEVRGYVDGSVVNTGDKIYNIEVRQRRRAVGNALFKRFVREQLTPDQQKYIASIYNKSFNSYHKPDYKQVPVTAEINSTFNPKHKSGKHPLVVKGVQKEGAAFLTTKGVGLLGYDVGVGKTLTSIVAINEVMKKGWAKRPLVIVPNGVYRNWINEISEVIPDIKINSLMNLGAAFKGDLKTLQVEEGTLSIITYDGLTKLGFKPETYDELTKDLKDVMSGVNTTKRSEAKEEAQIEQQIGRAIRGTTGDRFFEDLGFDHITIDEVQNFKNIFAGAKLERGQGNEYRNVRGSSSARGIKAYLMAQYILRENNNRNVFLLSATPFSNSPLEIYSILSLMGKKRLENMGLKNVNDFMSMYMELKPTFVVKADQTVKEEDVIEKFQNLQELQKIVTEFIDFRTGEEAGVERPSRIKRTIQLNPTVLQNEYVQEAQKLFGDKSGGGAIVAITELQNITLSPYLSRYNTTTLTYKEFVENSPKIKFAVEAVAQTHKDNKNVGQVIYMPRGVDHFPLLVEYLVKEKGFKSSEVAVVSGGMNIDVKQGIQDKFNKGDVKVLIGTEAIKEGVNLQERSTDLYHLHLPWNPTDMLQVEGRIWRQGNDYANVRIHYPLIENSVDSFIFQKLETKEKRIKNLWSYKENEINVGDLDFENMKLDLITDPMIRVRAEHTFDAKKETQKLEQIKVEKAFADRKIEKLAEAIKNLKYSEESLKTNEEIAKKDPESYEATHLDYYIKSASKYKTEVADLRADFAKKGVDVANLEGKSKELQTQIDEQQKVIEQLETDYGAKLEAAKGEEYKANVKPNNYFVLTKEIANENATFFKKRAGQDVVRAANTSYTAPSGTADVGGYSDIQSTSKIVANIKAVEFPEILRLTKELMGDTPTLRNFKRALGKFYSIDGGKMKFSPEIWKEAGLASKVLAHELGHLADYLPDRTLLRGNIIGRIHSLNKYLKGTFGESEVKNADIRAELKDLSQAWKPFDELQNPNFTSYRYSSRELYADAISVLFNDPALLQEQAPTFWSEFFDGLDSKPEVKDSFNDLWNLLNQGEEAVFNARNEEIDKAYAKAEQVWATKTIEKQKRKLNIFESLRTLFDDRNFQLNKRVKQQTRKGIKVEDRLNPMFAFEGLNYLDGKIKNFVADNFQPAYQKAAEVSDGWATLGKILQMERTIHERGEFANPLGYDPKTAKDFLAGLQRNTPAEDWVKIQEAKDLFRKGMESVVKLAETNGYYKPEMIETMKANPAYATYQVIDYLDTYVSASIKHQVGTLKEVANPATSSVMKAIATMKAIEYNNAKKSAVDFQRDFYKDEIEPAKSMWTGKFWEIIDSKDPEQGTVVIIRNGTPEGFYIKKDLAEVFNHTTSQSLMMGAKLSRLLSGSSVYRPLFVTINLGFQTFNVPRDFWRYWKNLPDYTFKRALLSLPRAVIRYGQALPHAVREQLGKPDALIKEMENSQILGLTFNDMFSNPDENEQRQIERVMQKAGVLDSTRKRNLLTLFYTAFDIVAGIGNTVERLPKIAGYIDLKGQMPEAELASFIRNYLGSPNFRTQGTLTPISNNIFMFSNAYKEGIKSDFQIATNYKTSSGYSTRSSFWWKTMLRTILPKAIMVGVSMGLAGDELRKLLEDASEYDKTNYDIIPIGRDENGKTIYLRVPQDETGRMVGGFFWKLSHLATKEKMTFADVFQVVDFGAGQVPNLVPSITGAGAILTYLSGQNPYDTFRGRNVIPDKYFKAGVKESAPIFIDWLLKQQGLGIVMPTYTPEGDLTTLEKILYAPISSNILGRWIKVSDYGRTEKLREIEQPEIQKASQRQVSEEKNLKKAVKEYSAGSQSITRKNEIIAQLIKDVVGDPPYKTEQITKRTNLIKKFNVSIIKQSASPEVMSLIYANTNARKVALLNEIKKEMSSSEFSQLKKMLFDEKIVSGEVLGGL